MEVLPFMLPMTQAARELLLLPAEISGKSGAASPGQAFAGVRLEALDGANRAWRHLEGISGGVYTLRFTPGSRP